MHDLAICRRVVQCKPQLSFWADKEITLHWIRCLDEPTKITGPAYAPDIPTSHSLCVRKVTILLLRGKADGLLCPPLLGAENL